MASESEQNFSSDVPIWLTEVRKEYNLFYRMTDHDNG